MRCRRPAAASPAADPAVARRLVDDAQRSDPEQLIEQALARNKTAKQAYARVVEARARRGIAAAGFLADARTPRPAAAAPTPTRASAIRTSASRAGRDEIYSAGLDSGWELDLFGGQRRALEAATAQLGASEADLRDVLVTLLGDVALSYVDVRTAQSRLTFAETQSRSAARSARHHALARRSGTGDVARCRAGAEQLRADARRHPVAANRVSCRAMNRLAVLTGDPPGSLEATLAERKPVPVAPLEIVAGVPADVLRRRPDIRSAERRLAAQTAQVGVATAALYPSLSLSGSITLQALSASDVLDGFQHRSARPVAEPADLPRRRIATEHQCAERAGRRRRSLRTRPPCSPRTRKSRTRSPRRANEQRAPRGAAAAASKARAAPRSSRSCNTTPGSWISRPCSTPTVSCIALEDSLAVSDGEMTANLIRLYKALGGGWSVFPKE